MIKPFVLLGIMLAAVVSSAEGWQAASGSQWNTKSTTSAMDGQRTVTAITKSLEAPAVALIVRCKGKRAETYVDTQNVVSEDFGVRIKFDQSNPMKQKWERSTNYKALFAPSVGDFLLKLKSAKKFYFEYTPYQKTEEVVSFDVSNLPRPLYEACVTSEIERTVAELERFKVQQMKNAAERAENDRKLDLLRARCAEFQTESLEEVERNVRPMPPHECWDILDWAKLEEYDAVAKRRAMCQLPAFTKDSNFCGPASSK